MRIGYVTQWFPPEPGTFVTSEIADGLARHGHQIDVLTGYPNYPDGVLQEGWRIQPYSREYRSERVTIHRAPLYPSHDAQALRRALNYASFAAGATFVARTKFPRPDVWLTYSSPATANVPAVTDRRRNHVPICMIIQDLWPDSVTQSGMMSSGFAARLQRPLNTFCDFTYRRADAIGVISPSMRRTLVSRGVPNEKIFDTPNWVSDQNLALDADPEQLRDKLGLSGQRVFVYAGNMGPMQDLAPLVDAFGKRDDAHFLLIGSGIEQERLRQIASGLRNVTILPAVSSTNIGQYLACAHVLVVSLANTALLRATMPSKLQISFAARRAVFVHGAGDVADVVHAAGAGKAATPGDAEEINSVISTMMDADTTTLSHWATNARTFYDAHFSPLAGTTRIEGMLLAAVNGRAHSA